MTATTGQQLTTSLRKSFKIGPRTRDRRDGVSLKRDMLDSIRNAISYEGFHGPERTALCRAAAGALYSYEKHVDGYRIDGELRAHIVGMTPYRFAAFLGEMVDAGVTNVGEGEQFLARMARQVRP